MGTSAISGLQTNAAHGSSFAATMATSGANGGDPSPDSNDGATISSSDFLTLLVTEMKNQDPTANQDPNEYINQLVQVNSLEQLISINQVLTSSLGSSTGTSKINSAADQGTSKTETKLVNAVTNSTGTSTAQPTAGNLGLPVTDPAAARVANALNHGRNQTEGIVANIGQ